MTKFLSGFVVFVLFAALIPAAQATVNITTGPTSLVLDPILVKASSAPVALFSFTFTQDAGETLSSVTVQVNQNATTTVSGGDLANISLYKDDGSGTFSSGSDALAGIQS